VRAPAGRGRLPAFTTTAPRAAPGTARATRGTALAARGTALAARGIALAACCAALAACSALGAAAGPSSDPAVTPAAATRAAADRPGSPAAVPRHPVGRLGSFWVGTRWMTFTEPAHVGVTGAHLPPRKLLTQTFYPLKARPSATTPPARGPFPLLAFAPGFMQCGRPYSRLLRGWASAGYVVVVVNFPHSDCKAGSAATESDMVNQPGDMSYVITRVLALSRQRRGLFAGLIDPREVAVTGQSDGGDTVAALAANTCCGDRRVSAVAVLSGAEWPPMPGRYFARRPVPMLFAQGSADVINWPGCSVELYRGDPAYLRYYLDLFGASHTGPYWGSNQYERVVLRASLAFFDRFVLRQLAAGPAMRRAGDVRGVSVLFSHGAGRLSGGRCDN